MKKNEFEIKCLTKCMVDNGFTYEDDYDMSTVYFSKAINDDLWVFALTEPHDGNKNRWMLRAERHEYFDKWGNASFEKFYGDADEFLKNVWFDLEELYYEEDC